MKSENLVYFQPSKAGVLNDFIFQEAKSAATKTDALLLQAEAYEMQLKYPEALQKIIEAKNFNAEIKDTYCAANIYIHLSGIFRKIDLPTQADEALLYAEKTLPDNKEADYVRLRIQLFIEQSQKAGASGGDRLNSLKNGMMLFKRNEQRLHAGLARKLQYYAGMAYMQAKKPVLAEEYFRDLITKRSAADAVDIYTVFAEIQLAEIAFTKGDIDLAANLLEANIENKNFSPNIFLKSHEILAIIYLHKKNIVQFTHHREMYIAGLCQLEEMKQKTKVLAIDFYESDNQNELAASKALFNKRFLITISSLALLLAILFGYYLNLKKRYKEHNQSLKNKKLLEETIETMKLHYTDENAVASFSISEKSELAILDKLAAFEQSELYTDHELSLKSLAKQLDTNTKYLSEIINTQKNKNFKTYINELRINYIIKKLQFNPEYRNYKTSHLASEAGFTSRSSFTIVFKTITGLSPSVFIASLKDETL